ncbi:MAG: hypothetical protein JSR66_13135 [Proteobacteria bacterium]|nr:hypothetical protein [Pseudomonadota bacterium]
MKPLYYGTINSLAVGSSKGAGASSYPHADKALDAASPYGVLRSGAVFVAGSIIEATAFAAAQFRVPNHSTLHVYRIDMTPLHSAPMAIVHELEKRVAGGGAIAQLVREYWKPTGKWHFTEILGTGFTIIEEVPAASEADTYTLRYIQYGLDQDRAKSL